MKNKNPSLLNYARKNRGSLTPQKSHLWYDFLRKYPLRFRRQHVVDKYILDFYCVPAKLAIELDGSQHYEPEALHYDSQRSEYLESLGIQVLRFTNTEINRSFPLVCEAIDLAVRERMGIEELDYSRM